MNIAVLLNRQAALRADAVAVQHGLDKVHDFRSLRDTVAQLAGGLAAATQGEPGARVGLFMENAPAYVELLLACWWAGLVAVPINAKLAAGECAHIVRHSDCRLVFVSPQTTAAASQAAHLAASARARNWIDVTDQAFGRLTRSAPIELRARDRHDLAWIFYTSGTTGAPKGAMLTHGNLLAMTLAYFASVDRFEAGDALVHAAPMSHGSGLYLLPALAGGACQLVPASHGFSPAELFDLMNIRSGLCAFMAPTMIHRLTTAYPKLAPPRVEGLKTIVYGGGPMYADTLLTAHARFGHRFAQIYGQGETPMTITALDKAAHADTTHPRYRERMRSVGLRQLGVHVEVHAQAGQALGPGEVGEVVVQGDTVMAGYWQDPAATSAAIKNRWLHTGDLGNFDEDGFLTLAGRCKELIISGGSNIYPIEVEQVLIDHPQVAEAAVVGEADAEWGEIVVAFIVAHADGEIDPKELDAFCRARIAGFKRPKRYHLVDSLPKNAYGKVVKSELMAQF